MTPVLRVAHVWGDRLLDVRHLPGDGSFGPLVRSKGRIRLGDEAISVPAHDGKRLALGETALILQWVEPAARPALIADDRDWSFLKLAGCLLVAFIALVAMMRIDVQLGFANADEDPGRFTPALRKVIDRQEPKRLEALQQAAQRQKQLELAKKEPAARSKAHKPLEPARAGILGVLEGIAIADDVFGPGPLNNAINQGLDNLHGPAVGDARGFGGSRGTGVGPPGPGLGFSGPIFGANDRPGGPPLAHLAHKGAAPCCSETRVTDGISKDVIGRVIRLHLSQVKFCYERELQSKPGLEGKVVVQFVIDATGSVSEADVAESTIDDANVEACVLAAVRRWKFPAPNGGGTATVTHPWHFKPAGAED